MWNGIPQVWQQISESDETNTLDPCRRDRRTTEHILAVMQAWDSRLFSMSRKKMEAGLIHALPMCSTGLDSAQYSGIVLLLAYRRVSLAG
jgi:hypothetical protein